MDRWQMLFGSHSVGADGLRLLAGDSKSRIKKGPSLIFEQLLEYIYLVAVVVVKVFGDTLDYFDWQLQEISTTVEPFHFDPRSRKTFRKRHSWLVSEYLYKEKEKKENRD